MLASLANRSASLGSLLRITPSASKLHGLLLRVRQVMESCGMSGLTRVEHFLQTMGHSLNPLPVRGFRVRPGVGHVVEHSVPKILHKVSKKTELQVNSRLAKHDREALIERLARKKALLVQGNNADRVMSKIRTGDRVLRQKGLVHTDEER